MLSADRGEDDVFFDCLDSSSVEEGVKAWEDLECRQLDYDVWINVPQSVKERRQCFMRGMRLDEFAAVNYVHSDNSIQLLDLGRVTEGSDAATSCLSLPVNVVEGNSVCDEREMTDQANLMVDELAREHSLAHEKDSAGPSPGKECEHLESQGHLDRSKTVNVDKKKFKKWWKQLMRMREVSGRDAPQGKKSDSEAPKTNRVKVLPNKKGYKEFTAVYEQQDIHAHKGVIWSMKFSPDGKYLATGGEDGVVRVWQVKSADAPCKSFMDENKVYGNGQKGKSGFGWKKSYDSCVIIPDKSFWIEESPLCEFHGHASVVLDLAWSSSNLLLSSSVDKTVRLWQVGCDKCLNVFHHKNYVTCIQFNPADDNYFISGSIDGKARIWGLSEKRVVDWADVRDIITSICYWPDGKGFLVGSIAGNCRFYEASGNNVNLKAEVQIPGRKKSSGSKITGIKFCQDQSQRFMITTEDSKVRIFDGVDIICKFKGRPKCGSQMSGSFTSDGKHIVSVGEDSRVYIWNYDDLGIQAPRHAKSSHRCEHFFCENVSIALPWSVPGAGEDQLGANGWKLHSPRVESAPGKRDSERFSLGNWFSVEGSCKASATWPEEKLPLAAGFVDHHCYSRQQQYFGDDQALPETWGLVIVTAGLDGKIKTFHNYGLPVRL